MYDKLFNILKKLFRPDQIFKFGFNISPMYRRSVGRVKVVTRDLLSVKVEIPLNYKNRNYVGSMFGGSLFSATDPIYMIQLIQILGNEYVVWDKSATIQYKKPARSRVYVTFEFSITEIEDIKNQVEQSGYINLVKHVNLVSSEGDVFAHLEKTIFISSKEYYRKKKADKNK